MAERFAFFDFDNTLSRGESIVPYLRYCVRTGAAPRAQYLRAGAAWLSQLGHPEHIPRAKAKALSFLRGMAVEEADRLARGYFREVGGSLLFPAATEEVRRLASEGVRVVVVSASPSAYMNILGEVLPVEAVLCTQCLAEGGRYTGEVGPNCRGEEKVRRIREWLRSQGAAPAPRQVLAYGDSAGDVPMLRLSSAPVLVSPGKKAAAMLPEARVVHWAQ